MGYKVYAGTLKVWDTEIAFSWVEKRLIFSTDAGAIGMTSDKPLLLEPKLTLSANDPGSLTFRVPERIFDSGGLSFENPMQGLLELGHVFVSVEEDDVPIFMGYIKSITKNFDLTREVTVTGVQSILEDVPWLLEPKVWNVTTKSGSMSRSDDLIGHYMPQTFMPGVEDINTIMPMVFDDAGCDVAVGKTVDTSDDGWQAMTFMDAVQTYILDEYGGYFRIETEKLGENKYRFVLRCTKDGGVTTTQTVEYGKNLVDLSITEEVGDIVNQVLVCSVVSKTKGWWIFKRTSTQYLYGYATDENSVKKYGLHRVVITNSSLGSTEACEKLAKEELAKRECYPIPELEASACDRVDAGVKTDRLGFLKKSRVVSKPHDVDGVYLCTKEVIPLDDMTGKQFTFGLPPVKLSKMQNQLEAAQAATRNVTRGIVSAMNSTNTASATAT